MEDDRSLLRQKSWRVIDQSAINPQFHPLQSFAMDDTLCHSVGSGHSPAVARTWVHSQNLILGIQDTKLPRLQDGIAFLKKRNINWIVRNSGGLAVLLDEGVLNISLIFPDTEKGIDINRGYDSMLELIRMMFQEYGCEIEAREIVGSYCPGSYDLSIKDKKFAGISQRRIRKAVAVQIYLCVEGSGSERAQLVKEFYDHANSPEAASKFTFPDIQPEVMASLSELLGVGLTVQDVMFRLLASLKDLSDHLYTSQLEEKELELFPAYYNRMIDRNNKVKV